MPAAPTTAQWLQLLNDNVKELDQGTNKSLKMLLYGPSGTGKTVQSVILAQNITPEDKTILYCDSSNGWVSLDNHPGLKTRVERIQIGRITTLEGIADVVAKRAGKFAKIGTIIVDEYSTIVDNDLSLIVRERASKDTTKDPDTPTQPDYNTSKSRGVTYANKLFLLDGVHIILVAHEREDKDNNNITKISPLFNPKLSSRIREAVHIVGYMNLNEVRVEGDSSKKEWVRTIQVHPSIKIVAKTRVGGLNPVVRFDQLNDAVKKWLAAGGPTVKESPPVMTEKERPSGVEEMDNEGAGITDA